MQLNRRIAPVITCGLGWALQHLSKVAIDQLFVDLPCCLQRNTSPISHHA